MDIFIDFETYSESDLRTRGGSRYFRHTSTEVLCMAYAVNDGPVELWVPGDPFPFGDIREAVLHAHNASFERGIWEHVCVKRYGWPPVRVGQWQCTAVRCAALALPRSLADAAKALGLDAQKDMVGKQVMMRLCKPKNGVRPVATAEDLETLYAYCRQDVETERAIYAATLPLLESEQEMYVADQMVNDVGIPIDRRLAEAAVRLETEAKQKLEERLQHITSGRVATGREVEKMLAFLADLGVKLDDLRAATVTKALKKTKPGTIAHEVLRIRQDLARASTAKYQAMLDRADDDDRVRGCHLFHGAATGRWSGMGIQPQNFPRPTLKDPETAAELIRSGMPLAELEFWLGPVHQALPSCLRSAICAPEGSTFTVVDFSQIEARVLAWLAGQQDVLDLFASGQDIYVDMATKIYDVPHDRVTKDQRMIGKCMGGDTLTLTSRGWVPLAEVGEHDLLWDGEAWVAHAGVVDNGEKETVCLLDINLTPDHLVLTGNSWSPAASLVQSDELTRLALAKGSENLPSSATKSGNAAGSSTSSSSAAAADQPTPFLKPTCGKGVRQGATSAPSPNQRIRGGTNRSTATATSSPTKNIAGGFSTVCPRSSSGATTRTARATKGTVVAASACSTAGETDARVGGTCFDISSRCQGGTTRISNSTEPTTTEDTSLGTCGSSTEKPTSRTAGLSGRCSANSTVCGKRTRVYDVLNAGPRNRFTVLSRSGPIIVHNCAVLGLGYGMGVQKFSDTCAGYGIKLEPSFAKKIVGTYREANAKTVRYWSTVEANLRTVIHKGEERPLTRGMVCRKVTHGSNTWAQFVLPSGRAISYHSPRLVNDEENRPARIAYKGIRGPQETYGGKLVENIVQATASDLLRHALVELMAAGHKVVAHVHDEVVLQNAPLAEVERIVSAGPDWSEGLPIGAEGYTARRYRK